MLTYIHNSELSKLIPRQALSSSPLWKGSMVLVSFFNNTQVILEHFGFWKQ